MKKMTFIIFLVKFNCKLIGFLIQICLGVSEACTSSTLGIFNSSREH